MCFSLMSCYPDVSTIITFSSERELPLPAYVGKLLWHSHPCSAALPSFALAPGSNTPPSVKLYSRPGSDHTIFRSLCLCTYGLHVDVLYIDAAYNWQNDCFYAHNPVAASTRTASLVITNKPLHIKRLNDVGERIKYLMLRTGGRGGQVCLRR